MTGLTPGNADDTFVLDHPILGSMTGLVSADTPDVVRFRAIPYATLPGRLKQSILRESLDGLSGDFTKPGKACPHSFEMDDVNSGGRYPGQETIEASESECLILEINVPKSQLEAMKKKSDARIPVMTYIHGGAFVLGKIDAQHNTAPMAQHSLTILKPVITTSIQYRLGALGFIATPNGEKNFGLKDQRNALLWIQKFIDGFGGDKHRVTLFGESAGGYSICCHMLSHAPSSGPLFSRVIIMSGVMGPMMTPIAEDKAAKAFGKICESLAIEEGGEPALEKLRALDLQKLIAASDTWYGMLGNSWSPVQDPSFFRAKITWDNVHELLAKCEWVEDIVVGNTGFEGQAHLGVANVLTPKSFHEHLRLGLSDGAAQQVMQAYNVTPDMDQNLFLTPAMRWSSDVVFDGMPQAVLVNFITTAILTSP
jgi:carboxylesterase type B